jgi:putative nucleotidyltransferase with HDIG domain
LDWNAVLSETENNELRVRQLLERLSEAEALLQIGLELAQTLDLQRVLELALERVEKIVAAETSSIWELDPEKGELFFRIVRGRVAPRIQNLRIPLAHGIVGAVAQTGRAEVIRNVKEDPRWQGEAAPEFETKGMLVVPLISRGRTIGVLQLLNPMGRSYFSEEDLRQMQQFAGPLAHAIENARLYARQRRIFLETVIALAEAVERRDPYTGGHLHRVVAYSLALGQELGLDVSELEGLRLGATLHDIGKIAVPDAILLKQGPLDLEEQEIMKRHVIDGASIVGRIADLRPLVPIIRNHHERWDGKGYPDGLQGEEIPLAARIVAVADTFDAMTTSRPYRKGLSTETAATEIRRVAGSHLCPTVVGAFDRLYQRGGFTLAAGEKILISLAAHLDYNQRRRER